MIGVRNRDMERVGKKARQEKRKSQAGNLSSLGRKSEFVRQEIESCQAAIGR